MAGKDYYNILGVSRTANETEIKQAYRKLARKYHPDVNPGDKSAEERFKLINEAYEVLSAKDKRQKYDSFGDQWQQAEQSNRAQQQSGQSPFQGYAGNTKGFQFEDADIESLFGGLFNGRARGHARPRRGRDLEYAVEVSLEEAYHGTTRGISLRGEAACSACGGTGMIQNVPCSVCRGSGVVPNVRNLEVKIPPGVKDGSRIRVAGQGGSGSTEGPSGDLYLVTSVAPHQTFERRDDDLYEEIPIPMVTAVLGGEVQVPTLKGRVQLKIPPETQNGKTFRLTKQGMPHLGDSSFGDLLAKVNVVLPAKLSEEEKKLFEQLKKLRPGS